MAVAVVNSTILKMNTVATGTSNLATADTDALAEVFTITPTVGVQKLLIEIGGTGSGADGDITASFAAGEFWASKIITATITKNTFKVIEIDLGMVLKYAGTVLLTLTPISTDKLVTDHHAFVKVYELV
jgi:hypothetical protein